MERVGICHHVDRVSPVFDVASNLRIFEVENGFFREAEEKALVGSEPFARAREVGSHGIKTVICGAVSRPLQQALHAFGVNVFGFICGSIDEVIRAFAEGRLQDERFSMPGCCGPFEYQKFESSFENSTKQGPLKIAVASIDGTMEGMVDDRFGRCRKLLLYAPQSNRIEVIDNEANTGSVRGAGIQTAHNAVNAGAHVVISGDFGPKAFQMLRAAGIDVYSAVGMTVKDALARFEEGKLTKLARADVHARQ